MHSRFVGGAAIIMNSEAQEYSISRRLINVLFFYSISVFHILSLSQAIISETLQLLRIFYLSTASSVLCCRSGRWLTNHYTRKQCSMRLWNAAEKSTTTFITVSPPNGLVTLLRVANKLDYQQLWCARIIF